MNNKINKNNVTKILLNTTMIAIFILVFVIYSIAIYSLSSTCSNSISKFMCFILWDILNVVHVTFFACIR